VSPEELERLASLVAPRYDPRAERELQSHHEGSSRADRPR
jgi:hypothetical protein